MTWYNKHGERIAAKTDTQHAVALAEAWGRHRACGAIFDIITNWMDARERTTPEVRVILDIRELVLNELRIADKRLALLRDMQLCRMQPEEDWSGVT